MHFTSSSQYVLYSSMFYSHHLPLGGVLRSSSRWLAGVICLLSLTLVWVGQVAGGFGVSVVGQISEPVLSVSGMNVRCMFWCLC